MGALCKVYKQYVNLQEITDEQLHEGLDRALCPEGENKYEESWRPTGFQLRYDQQADTDYFWFTDISFQRVSRYVDYIQCYISTFI